MKIFKTTTVALLSSLLIGAASMPARSATVADKATVVEKMPTKAERRRRFSSRVRLMSLELSSSHGRPNEL